MIFNDRMEIVEFEDKNNLYIFATIAGAVGSAIVGKVLSSDDSSAAGGGTTVVKPEPPSYISQSTPRMPAPPSYGGFGGTQRAGKQKGEGGIEAVKGQAVTQMWGSMLQNAYAQSKSTIKVE